MNKFIMIIIAIGAYAFTAYSAELRVQDLYGRYVFVPEKVERILALGPGALRMIVYAGAQDMLAGREALESRPNKFLRPYVYALPDSYNNLPVVSPGGPRIMPFMERINPVKPDVIFASGFTRYQLNSISDMTQIPVVGLSSGVMGKTDFGMIKRSLQLTGYITGRRERIRKVLVMMSAMRKDLLERTHGAEKKSVYMAAVAFMGPRNFNCTSKGNPSCELLGIKNFTGGAEPEYFRGPQVMLKMTSIIANQPDFIFYDITGLRILRNTYSLKSSLLMQLKAVRKGRVYTVMPFNWYNANVEDIFLISYFMGKKIYPERFKDVQIEKIAEEIYNTFLGTNPYLLITMKNMVFRKILFHKVNFSFD